MADDGRGNIVGTKPQAYRKATRMPPATTDDGVTAAGVINDNAKRSVSIRINTSDYGRIRIAARRLRTREADLFRYLLQVGLNRIQPLLGEGLDTKSYLRALAELGPDLVTNLGLGAREFTAVLQTFKHRALPEIEDKDYELIDLAGTHPRLVLERLGSNADMDVRTALHAYLRSKYPD